MAKSISTKGRLKVVTHNGGVDGLGKRLRQAGRNQLMVGIPQSEDPARDDSDVTNAEIGLIEEFGEPSLNIPARPSLVPGVQNAMPQVRTVLGASLKRYVEGDPTAIQDGLTTSGVLAVSSVKRKITQGPFVPLAPRTLADRKARGIKGTKPLIATGQFRNAITFILRKLR